MGGFNWAPGIQSTDGSIAIRCRICGAEIIRQPYRNFSTAICWRCHELGVQGLTEQEIYEQRKAEGAKTVEEVYNELGTEMSRAHGLLERAKDVLKKVRKRIRKEKKPLWEQKDPDSK